MNQSSKPERIYNPIMAMGFSAMFTFQLDNTMRETMSAPHCCNGSCKYVWAYLTDSYIVFTLKMESVSKNTIFVLKMLVKSGLEKIFLKFLHAGSISK